MKTSSKGDAGQFCAEIELLLCCARTCVDSKTAARVEVLLRQRRPGLPIAGSRTPWGVAESWRRNWEQIIPFYGFAPEVRKIIYTTNAIESLPMQLRKVLKNRGHFPSDEAATKLIYLALRNITKRLEKSTSNLESGRDPVRHPIRGEI